MNNRFKAISRDRYAWLQEHATREELLAELAVYVARKPPGRPPTGEALENRQRQQRYRDRRKEQP